MCQESKFIAYIKVFEIKFLRYQLTLLILKLLGIHRFWLKYLSLRLGFYYQCFISVLQENRKYLKIVSEYFQLEATAVGNDQVRTKIAFIAEINYLFYIIFL